MMATIYVDRWPGLRGGSGQEPAGGPASRWGWIFRISAGTRRMGSVGACRQCALVKQYLGTRNQSRRAAAASSWRCMTPVTDGAHIFASRTGDRARQFREAIVELTDAQPPPRLSGLRRGRRMPPAGHDGDGGASTIAATASRKNTHRNQYLGPLIHHEMNRCITCYRCTRYYRDYAGGKRPGRRWRPMTISTLAGTRTVHPAERIQPATWWRSVPPACLPTRPSR